VKTARNLLKVLDSLDFISPWCLVYCLYTQKGLCILYSSTDDLRSSLL